MARPLALQLYSLREEFKMDADATLRRVPDLGFGGVETAGDYGWDLDHWRHLLHETGLEVTGCHIVLEDLLDHYPKVTAFADALGASYLVLPFIGEDLRTPSGYREVARHLNDLAPRLAREELQLFYHHHDFEFAELPGGETGIEILLGETDPKTVAFQIDTYWVERGGRNAVEFIATHKDRIGALHLKDYDKATGKDTPVGGGSIDFPAVLGLAKDFGWPLVVEYEGPDPLAAAEASADYLRPKL